MNSPAVTSAISSADPGEYAIAVARKALSVQRTQGQAVVNLVQQATAVAPPPDAEKGRSLDVFA